MAWVERSVSNLKVGDRVHVKYAGRSFPDVGTVFFTGKGYTTAKRDNGMVFRVWEESPFSGFDAKDIVRGLHG